MEIRFTKVFPFFVFVFTQYHFKYNTIAFQSEGTGDFQEHVKFRKEQHV